MKKIAIIPARSGSKGLKDKNIIDVCGKPLIAYSIEAAIQCGEFDRVVVSTDSQIYGEISEKYGAEVMYRGETLSNDKARQKGRVRGNSVVDTLCKVEEIKKAIEKVIDNYESVAPVNPYYKEDSADLYYNTTKELLNKIDGDIAEPKIFYDLKEEK